MSPILKLVSRHTMCEQLDFGAIFNVFDLSPTERRLWVFQVLEKNFIGEQQLKMSGPANLRVRVPGMGHICLSGFHVSILQLGK